MVSNGNHPLTHPKDESCPIDELMIEEFVLGQLLPQDEDYIRQHITQSYNFV